MKSGTSYWNIPFIVHNLLTFALIIGLQHKLLDTITKTLKVVAEDLPQTLAVVEATAALVETSQFNDFNTTRTTVDSSPSQPSSWSSSHISSSTALAERRAMQDKLLSPSLTSPVAYPVSTTATMSGSPNTKTTRIMSHTNSATPTQTISVLHTTFKTRSPSRISKGEYSGVSSKNLVNKSVGTLQASISSYTPTPTIGIHKGDALTLLKNIKESKHNGKAGKINSSKSQSSSFYNSDQLEQKDSPHDFSFSKNYWTNTDAALNGGVDTSNSVAGSSGSVNFRLTSLSSVTSSSSSSVSAFSSSASSSSALSTTESERPRIFRNKHHHERHWGPFFEEPLNSTTSGDKSIIVAHLYTEAVLNCRVGMLKDKTVMWVRRTSEKVSLLTVGNVTYSSDPRIRVKFQYPNNWRLLINPTQWDDAGIYMCQVSTHPPRVFTTNLTVIEPPLRLIDDQERDVGDRYYKTGSTIDLQCQVSRSFLYKEKQNIVKSLKPLNIHNDSNTTINSSSTFRAAASSSASSQSTDIKSRSADSRNVLSSSSSNNNNYNNNNNNNYNNNKNETKIAANKNNNIYMSSTPDIRGTSLLSTTSSATGFGILSNDLLQSINQSEIHANKQEFSVEQEFSNFIFWSKDDEALPPTALKRTSSNDKWFTSRVTITDAKLTDSGNYSCSIGRMFMVIVQVQVLTGELPAAVQHNSVATISIFSESIRGLIQLYWIYVIAAYIHLHE